MEKRTIFLMVGLPGSGKSTIAENYAVKFGMKIVSSDAIRAELYGSEEVQGDPKEVFALYYKRAAELLKSGYDIILDATNISCWQRQRALGLSFDEGADIYAIVVNTPFDECLRRNKKRERCVPEAVIQAMYHRFTIPSVEEGFKDIIIL